MACLGDDPIAALNPLDDAATTDATDGGASDAIGPDAASKIPVKCGAGITCGACCSLAKDPDGGPADQNAFNYYGCKSDTSQCDNSLLALACDGPSQCVGSGKICCGIRYGGGYVISGAKCAASADCRYTNDATRLCESNADCMGIPLPDGGTANLICRQAHPGFVSLCRE